MLIIVIRENEILLSWSLISHFCGPWTVPGTPPLRAPALYDPHFMIYGKRIKELPKHSEVGTSNG